MTKGLLGLVVLCAAGLSLASESGAEREPPERYEITEVESTDIAGLETWAEDWCRGATVQELAASLDVEATRAAIADYLSKGLTGDAKRVVVDICERELTQTDN